VFAFNLPVRRLLFHQLLHLQASSVPQAHISNFQHLVPGSAKEAAWIAYRDSANTSIVSIGPFWLIIQKQVISALRHNGKDVSAWSSRLYINVDSYNKANAKSILFDVVTELQANKLLIADFGHLVLSTTDETLGQARSRCVVAYANTTDSISFYTTLTKTRSRPKARL
jgi:hypothetical protein